METRLRRIETVSRDLTMFPKTVEHVATKIFHFGLAASNVIDSLKVDKEAEFVNSDDYEATRDILYTLLGEIDDLAIDLCHRSRELTENERFPKQNE